MLHPSLIIVQRLSIPATALNGFFSSFPPFATGVLLLPSAA